MAEITISTKNINKPATRWFRKLKSASGYLVDGAIIMLLAMGNKDSSFLMLLLRVGYSRVMAAAESLLANGDDYVSNQTDIPVNAQDKN